jgi:hypothetical protein
VQIDDSLALIASSVDEIVAQRDQARAEIAELRAQRQAALAICAEVTAEYPGMGRGDIATAIRTALGFTPS